MRADLPIAIAFALLVHLLAVGLTLFTWHVDAKLAATPEVPPHVRAVVMEETEPAAKPKSKSKPKPKPQPNPEPEPKPAPKPEPEPEPEPGPETVSTGESQRTAKGAEEKKPERPAFEQPSLEEMLAREELEMEQARQSKQAQAQQRKPASSGDKTADDSELARHVSAIRSAVARHWNRPPSARNNMETVLRIRLLPGGEVVEASVVESSGNVPLDRSTVAAVKNASPLPVPSGEDFNHFREFRMSFKPEDLSL